LLEPEVDLIEPFGEQPGKAFAGGDIVRVALEGPDADVGRLRGGLRVGVLAKGVCGFVQRLAQRGQGNRPGAFLFAQHIEGARQ
jgi:hypothetical protein